MTQPHSQNVLVIGSGAREHAICWKISTSFLLKKLYALPGNAGIAHVATCIDSIAMDDHSAILSFCKEYAIDLVIIGPEAPLVAGLTDYITEHSNIFVIGPSKKAAQLETSKSFTHFIAEKYNIPMASYAVFTDEAAANAYIKNQSFPLVIKADGLAAGKGVIIAENDQEASEAIHNLLNGQFGEASKTIVIEEFLEGEELSFFALCDGEDAIFLGAAHDHKRVGEGDTGLNTGGMGTYAPSPFLDSVTENALMKTFIYPTMHGMKKENIPYKGILFAGIMLTSQGPKLFEFNARLGDPETQVIMMRMASDFLEICLAVFTGNLKNTVVTWKEESALCVVMATKGYPVSHVNGSIIRNLENTDLQSYIFHAATKKENGKITAQGGRVLSVTALGKDLHEAQSRAYQKVENIDWPEGFYRKDIGWRALAKN